jgi:hypothetical protein
MKNMASFPTNQPKNKLKMAKVFREKKNTGWSLKATHPHKNNKYLKR